MADGRTGGWTDGERRDSPLPCGTADKTIGYYRVFPRECCGGGRTRSYSASCLSIRLTRPRVWSLLFIGAETLVISQFSYNAVPHGGGCPAFRLFVASSCGAGNALCCCPWGRRKMVMVYLSGNCRAVWRRCCLQSR